MFSLFVAATIFVGCDSDDEAPADAAFTFEGRVTDEPGFGKTASVEGATVTAANLESNGSLTVLSGEATTDAEGEFRLEVDGASELIVLTAEDEAFTSEVLVFHEQQAGGTVRTMPMTTETEAEAAVYVESARSGVAGSLMTTADVAAHVNERLAVEWKNDRATAAQIAAAIEASANAQTAYFDEDEEAEVDSDEVRSAEQQHYLTLETELNLATTSQAQVAAIADFERALVEAYTDAGTSLEAQAKARQAGGAALIRFFGQSSSDAAFALNQQGEILTSLATARAIEARFEAEGSSETRLQTLVEARSILITALRAAESEAEIEAAKASYEAEVEAEVMAEIGIDSVVLAAVETALATANATLEASVASAGSATAVATAFDTFYPNAEASAETALAASSNAELGATVLTLLSAQ